MKIKHCRHWATVTWGLKGDMAVIAASNRLATEAIEARCRLGELFQWVGLTVREIEVAMNFFAILDVALTDIANAPEFVW